MSEIPELFGVDVLEKLADECGLAIAVVDDNALEISAANNNSICRTLNPAGKFSPACARFCGKAFGKAKEAGKTVGFTCHAGLDCRAFVSASRGKEFVVIVGRTFTKAENYRKATERAVNGDWRSFSPSEIFENVLLAGSSDSLEKATKKAILRFTESAGNINSTDAVVPSEPVPQTLPAETAVAEKAGEPAEGISELVARFNRDLETKPAVGEPGAKSRDKVTSETRAWRSFFGSILKMDYARAAASILEFLAHHYGFSALIWVEKLGDHFESIATFGEMRGRKVRLGVLPADQRLITALQTETALELGERSEDAAGRGKRTMKLFPLGVGGDISAAIAILDEIDTDEKKRQIARMCQSIAPQLEILRLRREVYGRDVLANAVRSFSASLKSIDDDDFWQNLTQNAAQMLRAERASLLLADEKSGALEIKAMIGAKTGPSPGDLIGGRVANLVFKRNQPAVVSDVSKTGLSPSPADRNYRTGSFFSFPINIGERTIGVMNFTDRVGGKAFDKRSLELFQAFAPQLAVAIDRAALKEKAGEFEQLSVTDALTGLLNRRYIEERLLEEIKRSNRHGFPMSFMMLDVDHFKSYNDQHGHPEGDVALKIVAYVIRDTLRGADVAARYGGEEFAILLPQTTSEEARAIAERIRTNIEHADFPMRNVTASIGVASCSADLCVSATLIGAADKALYSAKRLGRNRVVAFEELGGEE